MAASWSIPKSRRPPSWAWPAHTAVSQAVGEALATGVIERCLADLAIATTRVAGPEPDEDGNPVGLMHIAIACRGGNMHQKYRLETGDRSALRTKVVEAPLL